MTFNIVICDDENVQIEYLKNILKLWEKQTSYKLNITSYNSAEAFLFAYEDNKDVDILLLDIEMNKMNGIELAQTIRKDSDKLQIIFITGFADYMPLGYDVAALHYLMKPVSGDKLCQVLDKAVSLINKKEPTLILKINGRSEIINLINICYIESFGHYVTINMVSGQEYTIKMGITKIIEDLDRSFVACHRSYIVNLKYVKTINKTEVILDNNLLIPVSKTGYLDLNKAFIAYYRGE